MKNQNLNVTPPMEAGESLGPDTSSWKRDDPEDDAQSINNQAINGPANK